LSRATRIEKTYALARACPPLIAFCLLLALPASGEVAIEEETPVEVVELIPVQRASWSVGSLFAPLTGLFRGGTGYWYDPREIAIDTTPSGAFIDLFYVRGNFQKAYEQAESPVRVILPPRIEATDRDSLMIRVMADGYQSKDVHVKIRSGTEKLEVDLEPLANTLAHINHFYLAGRGTLTFLTEESLNFRNQKAESGFSVVLTETACSDGAKDGISSMRSPLIDSLRKQQLGQDLVVQIALSEMARDYEVRSRQNYDPIRRLHSFTLDLVPPNGGADEIKRSRDTLASIRSSDVMGCAEFFDRVIQEELDPEKLARALTPKDRFMDRYVRATIKRLGEVSPDQQVRLVDGSAYDVRVPIELSAATTQASQVVGYMAMLRSFIFNLEAPDYRRPTLKGLIAPEVSSVRFDAVMDRAEASEHKCTAGG